MKEILVKIHDPIQITIGHKESAVSKHNIIIAQEINGQRTITIHTSQSKTEAVAMAISQNKPSRPLYTHGLLIDIFQNFSIILTKAVITEVKEDKENSTNYYRAKLYLKTNNDLKITEIDISPSDAIATALSMGSPIFVNEEILEIDEQTNAILAQKDGEIEIHPSSQLFNLKDFKSDKVH